MKTQINFYLQYVNSKDINVFFVDVTFPWLQNYKHDMGIMSAHRALSEFLKFKNYVFNNNTDVKLIYTF